MPGSIELTDAQWERLAPLLPPAKATGRRRADDRQTINGILYVLRTGCRWCDLPAKYGDDSTCWRRHHQWVTDGTWERIWRRLLQELDEGGKVEWTRAFLDGTFVPAKRGVRKSG